LHRSSSSDILYSRIENMSLKPQDIVLLLKLIAANTAKWSFGRLGTALGMSTSHAFESAMRAKQARLLSISKAPPSPRRARGVLFVPNRSNLKEFLIHGVKYSFPVERGGITRGVPTAEGAMPLREYFSDSSELPPVWPYPHGSVRGIAFSPLYDNVPEAARRDPKLYELLALVDAIRDGRAREREIAIRDLALRVDSR
jgi:hypothetical protein